MPLVTVTHRTTYRYAAPVLLGDHRLMLRPRGGAEARILESSLWTSPRADLSWGLDHFGNVLETARFHGLVDELTITSSFTLLHLPRPLWEIAETVRGASNSRHTSASCHPSLTRYSQDPEGMVDDWAAKAAGEFLGGTDLDLMAGLCGRIHRDFIYIRRDQEGTQRPAQTLALGTGSCRDFAYLLTEAARSLGLPARFVSGYLYEDAGVEFGHETLVGGASTHAWTQAYLPGAGWVDFDPTNNLVGGRNLVASAIVLEPHQAVPLAGSYFGRGHDCFGMEVDVETLCRPGGNSEGLEWQANGMRAVA